MENKFVKALPNDFWHNIPIDIAIYDLDCNIQWVNRAYEKSTGLRLANIMGKKCYSIRGLTEPCQNCPLTAALKTDEPVEAELSALKKSGNQIQWGTLAKLAAIKNESGDTIGFVEILFDLSDHIHIHLRQEKTTTALLRLFDYATSHTAKELLRQFLDEAEMLTDSRIGFYHFVEEDQYTLSLQMWSTNTLRQCSAPGAGTHYPLAKAGVWVDCVRDKMPVIHNDYQSLSHKKGLPNGHVKVVRELVVPVIRAGKLVAILGVGNKPSDYDEYDVKVVGQLAELSWETVLRKRAEEENERLQKHYAQIQKTELVGRLAGGVAHDFNNMLSIILGHVDLAFETAEVNNSLYTDLIEIRNAAQRSVNLTRQLLAFARQQTIVPKPLNLNEVISDMLKMLRRLIGEDIVLTWIPGDNLGLVKMDPTQIDQILANLCVNARDAINGVGKLSIETRNVDFDDTYCTEHPEFRAGSYIMLAVSDNGCGMDQEVKVHIFEPFFTTKKVGEGTGLGLATVYGIIKQNQGFINLYSEPAMGTTFRIYLPRYDVREQPLIIQPKEIHLEIESENEVILLVEDESSILNLCQKMLNSFGYSVLTASTPTAAINLIKEYKDDVDLLITDIVMPEMNGRDLASQIKILCPDLKVLYMSGYTTNIIAQHGILQEGIVLLQKPFSKKELAAKIRKVMEQ
ncbi:MAG: GAF domain-containing protein [Desulfobacteraceae bacterium]|jgi:signal transduction histidine kinase/ActR/RegA family two-component response regulator